MNAKILWTVRILKSWWCLYADSRKNISKEKTIVWQEKRDTLYCSSCNDLKRPWAFKKLGVSWYPCDVICTNRYWEHKNCNDKHVILPAKGLYFLLEPQTFLSEATSTSDDAVAFVACPAGTMAVSCECERQYCDGAWFVGDECRVTNSNQGQKSKVKPKLLLYSICRWRLK